jgi:hypothetical protein
MFKMMKEKYEPIRKTINKIGWIMVVVSWVM